MKRNLLPLAASGAPLLAVLLAVALSIVVPSNLSAATESKSRIVGVDYVLALMDAGIDQKEIVKRIEEKNLGFRIAPVDVDRLREAGAGKHLIEVVVGEGTSEENQEGTDSSQWGRPNRLGGDQPGDAQEGGGESYEGTDNGDEGIQEEPYGGYGAYPNYDYYWPGYYGFVYTYGYPYYYYPYYSYYYYPYRSHYYYGSYYYPYPRHYYRTAPRGSGWVTSAPRGGGVHSAPPHGGGGSRTAPRGGGGRPNPRGSHH